MNVKSLFKKSYIQFILLGLLLSTLPYMADLGMIRNSTVTVVGITSIYTIAALGLNVLLGFSGLVSLGTAGFMGLAAYVSAYVVETLNLPFEVGMLAAIVLPTLLGLIVGVLSLKFEGIYLGIATLVVAEILREIFINVTEFTGGTSGANAGYPTLLGTFQLNRTQTYYLIVAVMVLVFILIRNLTKGHLGRALNAMRGSEAAAQAMGVNIFQYRLIAFGIATVLASISGVLYVHYVGLSYPTTWNLMLSLDFLAIIVVGGFRSIFGTFIGAFVIFGLSEIFLKPIPALANITPLIKGILIILFVLYNPNGIASFKNQFVNWYKRRQGQKDEFGRTKENVAQRPITQAEVRENDTI